MGSRTYKIFGVGAVNLPGCWVGAPKCACLPEPNSEFNHRGHRVAQRGRKIKITTLCDPLRSLRFNLPYHNRILRKSGEVHALANYRESLFFLPENRGSRSGVGSIDMGSYKESKKEKKIPEMFRAIYTLLMPNDWIRISGLAVPHAIVFLLLRSFTMISAGANIAPSTLKKSKPAALNVSKNGFP